MSAPKLVFSQPLELPDGRSVRVLAYDDGAIRVRVRGGLPYVLSEAFLTGSDYNNKGQPRNAIIKLDPRRPA